MFKSLIGKIKSKAKVMLAVMSIAVMIAVSCIPAGAEGETTMATLQESFSSSLATVQSDILGFIVLALPVGLAIFGTVLAIKKGITFVKGLIGKA
ncbi:MAG: hypothetical protein UH241_04445 [Acutalibacteraceae bacterium]|nr:hypothetical protein [Acutalibacteraceae bacterium]